MIKPDSPLADQERPSICQTGEQGEALLNFTNGMYEEREARKRFNAAGGSDDDFYRLIDSRIRELAEPSPVSKPAPKFPPDLYNADGSLIHIEFLPGDEAL